MRRKAIHVVGIGTIGDVVANILADIAVKLDVTISFSKKNVKKEDVGKIKLLQEKRALFVAPTSQWEEWSSLGIDVSIPSSVAEVSSNIIIDCAEGANDRKPEYEKMPELELCIAQGSEKGFGYPFAYGIVPITTAKFIQVVSCNTHQIAATVFSVAIDNGNIYIKNLKRGDFVLMRRSTDLGQEKMNSSVEAGKHDDPKHGTHQATDASDMFRIGSGCRQPNIFSSVVKIPNQLMHVNRFQIRLEEEKIELDEIIARLKRNKMIALTEKKNSGSVFSFGRDHGYMGRIMNQVVIPTRSIFINREENLVIGESFTPQDGNSILSTIYLVLHHLGREDMMEKFLQPPYVFQEI